MKIDIKEIVGAWYNKIKHTPEQKELADKRFEICSTCTYKKEILKGKNWTLKCGKCGCLLSAKVYTEKTHLDKNGSCPLHKWKEAETEYMIKKGHIFTSKSDKTII